MLVSTWFCRTRSPAELTWMDRPPTGLVSLEQPALVLLGGDWTATTSLGVVKQRLGTPELSDSIREHSIATYSVDVTKQEEHQATLKWLGSGAPMARPLVVVVGLGAKREFVHFDPNVSDLATAVVDRIETAVK